MFLPINESRGSIVNGVPSAWLIFFELRSAISWSIKIGSSMVLNDKFLVAFISFHCTNVSVGMSIVFKFVLA